jgi:hypothetical protein
MIVDFDKVQEEFRLKSVTRKVLDRYFFGARDVFLRYHVELFLEVFLRFLFIFLFHVLYNWASLVYVQGLPLTPQGYIGVFSRTGTFAPKPSASLPTSLRAAAASSLSSPGFSQLLFHPLFNSKLLSIVYALESENGSSSSVTALASGCDASQTHRPQTWPPATQVIVSGLAP